MFYRLSADKTLVLLIEEKVAAFLAEPAMPTLRNDAVWLIDEADDATVILFQIALIFKDVNLRGVLGWLYSR